MKNANSSEVCFCCSCCLPRRNLEPVNHMLAIDWIWTLHADIPQFCSIAWLCIMFLWLQGQNQWLIKSRVDHSIVAMDMDLSMVVWGDGTVCEPKDVESQDSSSSSAVSTAKKSSRKAKSSKGGKSAKKTTKTPKSRSRKDRTCTSEMMSGNYSTWKKTPAPCLI